MYKMNLRLGKFTVFLFSLMLIIGIIYTISYYSYNKQFVINIYAIKEGKKDQDKSKGEEKDNDKSKGEEKEVKEDVDSWTYDNNWTRTDQDLITKYNYRNLAIPKIYQTALHNKTKMEAGE